LLSVFVKAGNGDIVVTVVKFFVLTMLYSFLIFLAVAVLLLSIIPVIEELIFYRISREREFLADAEGALMTRYPKGLIGALEKISYDERPMETANALTAHLYIASPFRERLENFWSDLFHSHPSLEERIEVLKDSDGYEENDSSTAILKKA
jgi:Zn-dependent protease with chaperone function